MRPLFGVMFVPSTPMNDDRLTTSGSFRITAASACCRCAIAVNEMVCGGVRNAENHAGILHREKTLGHVIEKHDRQHQRAHGHEQRGRLMPQHQLQRSVVRGDRAH